MLELDGVAAGDEVVGRDGHGDGLAGCRGDGVVDGDRRLRVTRGDDADADERPAHAAEAVDDLVVDDLGARGRGEGLVADRRGPVDTTRPQAEGDRPAVRADDAGDADGVAVGVDARSWGR